MGFQTILITESRVLSFACIFEIMNNNNEGAKEQTRCFVCDADIKSRFYCLATCRTQSSRTRVIEKLGELVGEGYMVVISEDDVICRSCAILVNTLDRLEMEMRKARNHILRFLEQKYSLKEGELRDSGNKPKPCQPPQIIRSGIKEITCSTKSSNKNDSNPEHKRILSKSHSWLQCNKCKYTTHLNSFMMHHLRDYIKEKVLCNNCGNVILRVTKHNCSKTSDLGNKENENNSNIIKNEAIQKTLLEQIHILPITQATPPPPLIDLSNCNNLYGACTLSTSDATSSQEPMYALQSIDMADIDNSKTTRFNLTSVQKTELKGKDKGTKQVLIVKDDGSLSIVEVPWNEMEIQNIN